MESEHSEDGKGGGEKLDRLVLEESAERGELSRGQEIGKGYTAYPIGPSEILLSTGEVEEAGELVLKSERPESPRGEEGGYQLGIRSSRTSSTIRSSPCLDRA